jgi:hypothetical protein
MISAEPAAVDETAAAGGGHVAAADAGGANYKYCQPLQV